MNDAYLPHIGWAWCAEVAAGAGGFGSPREPPATAVSGGSGGQRL